MRLFQFCLLPRGECVGIEATYRDANVGKKMTTLDWPPAGCFISGIPSGVQWPDLAAGRAGLAMRSWPKRWPRTRAADSTGPCSCSYGHHELQVWGLQHDKSRALPHGHTAAVVRRRGPDWRPRAGDWSACAALPRLTVTALSRRRSPDLVCTVRSTYLTYLGR